MYAMNIHTFIQCRFTGTSRSSASNSTGDEYVDILQVQQLLLDSSTPSSTTVPSGQQQPPAPPPPPPVRPRINVQKAAEYSLQPQGK